MMYARKRFYLTLLVLSFALVACFAIADEGRIPIYGPPGQSLPITISSPGHYYLARDINASGDAINITSSNVTLDLNGHTITGPLTAYGIHATSSVANVRVTNGTIVGFFYPVYVQGSAAPLSWQVDHLRISGFHGVAQVITIYGQSGADTAVVEENTISNAASGSTGSVIVLSGISSGSIRRNVIVPNANMMGIWLKFSPSSYGNRIEENTVSCSGSTFNGIGLYTSIANEIGHNTVYGCRIGIYLDDNSTSNTLEYNTANCANVAASAGVSVLGSGNVVDWNTNTQCASGLIISGTGNVYSNNHNPNNTTGHTIVGGNFSVQGNNDGGVTY